jgi:hypothetical protein
MFIFWGRKRVDQKLGIFADFCFICRNVKPFILYTINMSSHIYGGAVGKKELIGYKACCNSCGAKKEFNDIYFDSYEKGKVDMPINELARRTFQKIKEVYANRFNLESQIKQAPFLLTKEQRVALIEEPFKVLSNTVEEKLSQTNFDLKSFAYLVLAIILPIFSFKILESFNANPDLVLAVVSAVFVAMAALMCYQIYRYPSKYLESIIYPKVAQSISVLNPSTEEIAYVFERLCKFNMKIATKGNLNRFLKINKKS